MTPTTLTRLGAWIFVLGLLGAVANAQDTPTTTTTPTAATAATTQPAAKSLPVGGFCCLPRPSAPPPPNVRDRVWPDLSIPTIAWFAVVAILALSFQPKPLLSLRNLDALILAGMCLLLMLRDDPRPIAEGGYSRQWWAYLGLTGAAAYWLLRGIGSLVARPRGGAVGWPADGVLLVLFTVGVALCIHHIAVAPVAPSAEDALAGGIYTAQTGYLPYGDVGGDSRSPLLYLVTGGLLRISDPAASPDAERLLNVVLFVFTVIGVYVIGRRLQSPVGGVALAALYCIFPATVASTSHPGIMLATMLLTWAVAFALLPGIGGLLGMVFIVLAGIAWPWAWLALPVMLACFLRRGWQAPLAILGLAGGVALAVFGLIELVQPTLPQPDGALRMAGIRPLYQMELTDDGTLIVNRRDVKDEERTSSAWTRNLWRQLVQAEDVALKDGVTGPEGLTIDWPKDLNGHNVAYRQVEMSEAARGELLPHYRAEVAELPPTRRALVGLRTIFEHTWLAHRPPREPIVPAWELWGGDPLEPSWVTTRRVLKVFTGLIVIWATLAVFFGKRNHPRQLATAILVVLAIALLASASGAVMNVAWLLPLILVLWTPPVPPPAGSGPGPAAVEPQHTPRLAPGRSTFTGSREPRITVENRPKEPT